MLQMLEPMTLPIASPGRSLVAALMEIASSGALVANATMVSPATSGDMCRRLPRPAAAETSVSPPT